MGLAQTAISVCNDGNVSQLDVVEQPSGDIYYRIEVYRCSQPPGGYGVTLSGSRAEHICGHDHLGPDSNRTFRYLFAVGDDSMHKSAIPALLEGREVFNPDGPPDGSWEVRLRDIDSTSPSYGAVLLARVWPTDESMQYHLEYELRVPSEVPRAVALSSPIGAALTDLNPDLPDLASSLEKIGESVGLGGEAEGEPIVVHLTEDMSTAAISKAIDGMVRLMNQERFSQFRENLDLYEAFGDFGSKAVHPGTNLTGPNARLAAESIFVRQYRSALVLIGRISSPDMARGAAEPQSLAAAPTNTRPGVYANFVGAAINNIGIYKLGLDKVHSDYGGVPMALAPGSRLETGTEPIADAWRCNQTLGEMAKILYLAEG